MLVLALRPGLEDIVIQTSDGEIRIVFEYDDAHHRRVKAYFDLPGVVRVQRRRRMVLQSGQSGITRTA